MASNFALFLAMTLIHLGVASWYRIRGPITVTSLVTVTGSYHLVTLTEVTFSGVAAGIRINVGDMMTTHGTSTPLSIQLCSCTFTSGASLYFYGRTSPVSTATNSAPIDVEYFRSHCQQRWNRLLLVKCHTTLALASCVLHTTSIGGGSTYSQIPGGPHTASGLLIASAAFRAGSSSYFTANPYPSQRTHSQVVPVTASRLRAPLPSQAVACFTSFNCRR